MTTIPTKTPLQASLAELTALPSSSWKALALLLSINMFNYIDRYLLSAMEPLISRDLLPSDPNASFKMGWLATAFLVSYMIAAPVFGYIADRWRRWGIIAVGVVLWSLASGGSGLANGFAVLLATRMFVGIGEGGYGPVAPTLISDYFPASRRGFAMSLFYIAMPVGLAIGYGAGGWLGSSIGWRNTFLAVVIPGLVLGALALVKKDPVRTEEKTARAAMNWQTYKTLLSNKSYVSAVLGMTAMTFAIGGMSFWMPTYIHVDRNAGSLEKVTFYFGLIAVITGIAGTILGGLIADKLKKYFSGAYLLVSGISMLLAFPLIVAVIYTPFPACWWVITATLLCLFLNTGPSNAVIANVTAPSVRMSAFAISIFTIHALGDAISPPLIGRIRDASHGEFKYAFLMVAGTVFLGGIIWTWGSRFIAADEKKNTAQ